LRPFLRVLRANARWTISILSRLRRTIRKRIRLAVSSARIEEPFIWPPVSLAGRVDDTTGESLRGRLMNGLIYLIGLIVVIMAILSFLGLH
jgi:hypothetical protein